MSTKIPDLELSKKCFTKCGKGHRAFKVPGEKNIYWCPDCAEKVEFDGKPYYVAQFDKKKKKDPEKTPGPKKKVPISDKEVTDIANVVRKIKLVAATNCHSCLHKNVCFILRQNPKANLYVNTCSEFYRILS